MTIPRTYNLEAFQEKQKTVLLWFEKNLLYSFIVFFFFFLMRIFKHILQVLYS